MGSRIDRSETPNNLAHGGDDRRLIPAAQYVRMSTEHQRYSTANQADAIAQYASRNGMEIVRSYTDSGKSGLRIEGREGLKRLIADIGSNQADFEVILVYDVSRWGRFQDADESAHYEFMCRSAGIAVHYCAEQFENDGSPVATIVKGVKRAMAGEYSRELSAKVFAGQCRLVEMGFRQGGPAGYGLRRMLIDENGEQKTLLEHGQQKSLQTDRVILVPGPPNEVQVIRRMYQAFVEDGKSEVQIADWLNQQKIATDIGRPWTRGTVHQVLTNEKYIGNNVFNRTSFKLKKRRVTNPPDMWVRADGAFEPIVEVSAFHMAQGIIRERSRRFSDEEMLTRLKEAFVQHGYLSGLVIDESENMPSSSAYRYRFGSLLRAYTSVGFHPSRDYRYIEINQKLRKRHSASVAQVIAGVTDLGAIASVDPKTELLHINQEFTASICIARHQTTIAGSSRWKLRFDTGLRPDVTIGVRMNQSNAEILDYYLLPLVDFTGPVLRLAEENGVAFDAYRFDSLDFLFDMAERRPLPRVA